MSATPKLDQVCIGISIEGDLLRLAAVGRQGTTLRILDLASMPIPILQKVMLEKDEPASASSLSSGAGVQYRSP